MQIRRRSRLFTEILGGHVVWDKTRVLGKSWSKPKWGKKKHVHTVKEIGFTCRPRLSVVPPPLSLIAVVVLLSYVTQNFIGEPGEDVEDRSAERCSQSPV